LGTPFPTLGVILAASAEFFGGLALLLGAGVHIASVPMTFTMLVAAFLAHGGAFDGQKGGMEYPLTLAVFLVALALLGPGDYTVRRLVRGERRAAAIPLES
jgi:putative oxidoreductase